MAMETILSDLSVSMTLRSHKMAMETILSDLSVSMTQFKKNPNEALRESGGQGYRLVYMVEDDELVVLVLSVGKRGDDAAYRAAAKRIK